MIGEISLGGVYVPSLLMLVGGAAGVTWIASCLLSVVGFYRIVAYRPLVDLALFGVVLALLVRLTTRWGLGA